MSEPIFPATRFRMAGATDVELDTLVGEFDRSDIAVRGSMSAYFEGISEGDIREYLARLREADHFAESSETETKDETEPLAADSIPVPVSGATADAGDEGAAEHKEPWLPTK